MYHHSSLLQHLTKKHSELKRKPYWGSWGLLNTHTTQCGSSYSKAIEHSAATVFYSPAAWLLGKGKVSLINSVFPGNPQLFYSLWAMGNHVGVLETTTTNPKCLSLLPQAQQYSKWHLRGEKPPSYMHLCGKGGVKGWSLLDKVWCVYTEAFNILLIPV